jgi:hypothetical protein
MWALYACGQIDALAALTPTKAPPNQLYGKVGGFQGRSESFKKFLPLQKNEPRFISNITSIITINIACAM